jgi:peptide/nickel transport system substrate-binding protein
MRKRWLTLLVALGLGATLGGAPVAAQDESVLRVARLADHFNFFHPVQFQTGNQFQWWNNIFNTLVNVESDSRTVVPSLAESWDISDDATEFTFTLVDNATWHDGEPFTADDVLFTINWYLQNSTLNDQGALLPVYQGFLPQWGQIAGATDVPGTTDPVSGVEKVDDHTVKITLAAPNAEFLLNLADMANVIMPEHALSDATAANVEALDFTKGTPGVTIGTGPYKLASFTADQELQLEANPDYFKGAPNIDRIVFRMFADPALAIAQLESGDLDLAFRVPPSEFDRLSAIDGLEVISAPNPGIVRIVFATEKAPWSNRDIRQAFAYAVNKQAIVDQFYGGRAQVLYNHPGFTVYDDINKYEHDTAKATELLTSGGYNNEPFRLLYDTTFPDAQAIMPLIQADLQAAGINVELLPTEGAEAFVEILNDRTQWDGFMHIGGSEALSPDKSSTYYSADPALLSGFTDPRVLELFAEGRSSADPEARDAAYHELALLLNTELPMAHLYTPDLVMVATDRLGGGFDVHLNERETFMDVETWTLEPAG